MALLVTELTIDTVSWTSWACPDDYNIVSFYNKDTASDLKLRTISSDPTTEILIPAGIEKKFGDYPQTAGTVIRYPKNVIFGYFQAISGTGPVKITAGR